MAKPPDKVCEVCGRRIEWRKKWERDWDSVKYCSKSCRSQRSKAEDDPCEQAILDLLAQRDAGSTICPSEAAKLVEPDAWRDRIEDVRRAARRLVASGKCVITQRGEIVDPSTAKGPIRIGLAANSPAEPARVRRR